MNVTHFDMTQATIEMFCGFICLMLAVIVMMNGHGRKSWKLIKKMLICIAGIFFSEACAYILRGNTDSFYVIVNRISNFGVFLLNVELIRLFIRYMYCLFEEKGVTPGRRYRNIVNVCVVINFAILLINLFTKWMYYFDESNLYHRNTGWYLYTLLDLVCILTMSAMSIHYRKVVSKTMLAALLFYSFTPVIAIILQALFYGIAIANIGIFVAMIVMLLAYLKEWSHTNEGNKKERKALDVVVLFFIMTVSMSASVLSCILSIKEISNQNSENNSMLIAHMVSDGIENEFLKPIVVAETMSNDYSLKQYMKKSGEGSPDHVEKEVAAYLNSIRTGFGYQMVFAVCDASGAYYTYDGITKYVDIEKNEHDYWYKKFLEEKKHYDLDVDTDEANHWNLSVFVNTEIRDENGTFLGVCGVVVEMGDLQKLLKQYEETYRMKINLIDEEGLIQVDSDEKRIECDYLDNSYLSQVTSTDFTYQQESNRSRMTKYMEDLDWYLVVEDYNPDKINVVEIISSSVIIFLIGLMMMGIVFAIIFIRERKALREIAEKRKVSITDDMTGLFNHRAYEEDCLKILETDALSDITMIMMDVNGLKNTNDTYGHMAGDELIIGAANCIQTSMGEYGKVYRTGGDEFVALLQCSGQELQDMIQTFEHIVDRWKGTYESELSISKGIVVAAEHGHLSFDEMKQLADKLMYEDKDEYYRRTGKQRGRK